MKNSDSRKPDLGNTDTKKFDSFINIFKHANEAYPERKAIILEEESRTYGELYENARRIAGYIHSLGIGKGDRIAVISRNSVDYIETVLGCIMAGAVAVKLNWRLAPPELHYLLVFNQVKLIFFRSQDAQIRREVQELVSTLCPSVDMELLGELAAEAVPLETFEECGENEVLMHLHTSGTTGVPKTVRYVKGRFLQELSDCVEALGFPEGEVFQQMSQLFHSACMGTYSCLASGGTVVLFRKFDPETYLASVERNKVTRMSAIPTVLVALLNHPHLEQYDLSSIRIINYSTCPMPPELIRRAIAKFHCGFQQSYGMTEMGSIVTILMPEDHLRDQMKYLNSVGKPIGSHQVRVADEQGADCPPGVIGEVLAKGPGMMLDYYRMPEETGHALADGWYHTKDMGYLDEAGYLYICGRKHDLIISGGENIFPLEVENVLKSHPGIEDVAVLGMPDPYWGEAVYACVTLKNGQQLTEEQIRSFCRGKIAGYKIPKQVHILTQMPLTATGKIKKPELAKWIGEK